MNPRSPVAHPSRPTKAAGRRRRRVSRHAASKSVQIEDSDEGAAEKEQEQPLADEPAGIVPVPDEPAVPAPALAPVDALPVPPVVPVDVPLVAALPAVAPPPVPDDDTAPLQRFARHRVELDTRDVVMVGPGDLRVLVPLREVRSRIARSPTAS